MTYLYRQASTLEKQAIFELYRVVMSDYISQIWGWNEDWQTNDFSTHFNPEEITLVYKENELVAYSHIEIKNEQLYLRMIAIHPDQQRNGIGTKLLESLIASAKEQSKSIALEVFKINTQAKRLYEKYGFNVEGETDASYIMSL